MNNGAGGFAAPILLTATPSSTPAGFAASNIQPNISWIDIDNDGIPDLVLLYANGNSVAVQYWPGLTGGTLGNPVTLLSTNSTPGNAAYTYSSNYKLQLVDVNGDGAPDLIAMGTGSNGATADIWLNTGAGNFASVRLNVISFTGVDLTNWTPNFADVNGDGIVDVVYASANAGAGAQSAYVFMGNGDGAFSQAFGIPSKTVATSAGATGWQIFTSDTGGTGRTDLQAYNATANGLYVQTWSNAVSMAPTLVSSVSNGIGVSASFNYSTLSNAAVYTKGGSTSYPQINLNIPLNVVASVQSPDGVGGTLTTSYRYGGLRAEEYTGRGLLGFESMATTQVQGANTVSTTTTFAQAWPFTGLPLAIAKSNSAATGPSHQISLITNVYDCQNTVANGATGTSCVVGSGKTYFPFAKQTTERSWDLDGTALPTVVTSNAFDGFGNALTTTTGTGDGYSKTSSNTYTNDTTNWYLGRLTQSSVTSLSPASSAVRTSAFTYNATNGLLVSETVEPNQPQFCVTTTYAYDTYGNKAGTTTTNCAGATDTALFTSRPNSSSTAATTANPVAGQFVTSSTNALNQGETYQYDQRFGQTTSLTGPNGLTTTWSFDAMGRKTLETRADGNRTKTQYLYCSGTNGGVAVCPTINGATAAYVVVSTPLASDGVTANGAYSKAYFDALGRKLRVETQGFDGTGSSTAIYQDSQYNNLGQVVAVSRPYYAGQTAYWNATSYDALGRAVLSTSADGSTYTVQYSGLVTTTTNAKGQTTVTTKNSQAQVVSVKDANGQTTTFQYDPLGNLTTTTDVAANITTQSYDIKGRKTQMVDPDMGTWTYSYDALGQLVAQIDANGNRTTMTYDQLGRMTQRIEADLKSYWYFDKDSTNTLCPMGVGKLCQAATSTGYNRKVSFDSLGRASSTVTTIGTTYSDSATFDSNGRVATRTYPGGVVVQYGYTPLGYLQSITRTSSGKVLWAANTLDAEGHLLTQTLGNGLTTTQAYYPDSGRIKSITTGPGNLLQNATYQYDALGNVSARNDNTQTLVESFGYDDVNRMTTSTVNASAASYTDTFTYANSGNIYSRSDLGNYSYQTIAVPADLHHNCPDNSQYLGGMCVFNQTTPATPNYKCTTAGTTARNGDPSKCDGIKTVPANIIGYLCGGQWQSYSSCTITSYPSATPILGCPSGYVQSGNVCYIPATRPAFTVSCGGHNGTSTCYYCSSLVGYVLSGSNCVSNSVTITADNAGGHNGGYSCPASYLLTGAPGMCTATTPATTIVGYQPCTTGTNSGAYCVVTTPGTSIPQYGCASGTLSGTYCNVPITVDASVTFSCTQPNQYLLGNQCVTTSNDTKTYTCPSNSQIPIGSQCVSNAIVNPRPHAVSLVATPDSYGTTSTTAASRFASYDANGNRAIEAWQQGTTIVSNRNYSFTSFNMPLTLSATANGSTVSETYSYGPEHQRVTQMSTTLGTVYYLNPGNSGDLFFEKEIKPDNSTELRSYITVGGNVVAQVKQVTTSANVTSEQTLFFHRDNLGSTSVVTDINGNLVERMAYEPFGKRRQVSGPQDPSNALAGSSGKRGFTNHEHMDELGLINMNGRVYDPTTARFISADPMVQAPLNSQSYNRYSYVWNSPLNMTDPSGYCGGALGQIGICLDDLASSANDMIAHYADVLSNDPNANLLATIAAAYFTQDYVGAGTWQGAAAGGFAGGMVSSKGDLNSGMKGAATALMFYGVGTKWKYETYQLENIAGHAAVGCISATMSGGDCGSSAVAAGIADYASNSMPTPLKGNLALETAYVAVVGGTTSVIAGGKFENGAKTAAFGYLFNSLAHAWAGTAATYALADQLNTRDGGGWIVNKGSFWDVLLSGRVDLVAANGETYEIKTNLCLSSASCAQAAEQQLNGYIADSNGQLSVGSNYTVFRGQTSILATGSVMGVNSVFSYNPSTTAGLIGYDIIDRDSTINSIWRAYNQRKSNSSILGPLPAATFVFP